MNSSAILVIDANQEHCEAIVSTMLEAHLGNVVKRAHSIAQGQEILNTPPIPEHLPERPTLVLLDTALGLEPSLEFIRWLRAHPVFCRVPVVSLVAPGDPAILDALYAAGVNSCLLKPFEIQKLRELTKSINGYWILAVQRPVIVD